MERPSPTSLYYYLSDGGVQCSRARKIECLSHWVLVMTHLRVEWIWVKSEHPPPPPPPPPPLTVPLPSTTKPPKLKWDWTQLLPYLSTAVISSRIECSGDFHFDCTVFLYWYHDIATPWTVIYQRIDWPWRSLLWPVLASLYCHAWWCMVEGGSRLFGERGPNKGHIIKIQVKIIKKLFVSNCSIHVTDHH